ncbi:MAG TPA: radical SAM protein [Hyphomonadaceae bacterium]|nr:radical SAM protein [Hyphomonadaceae bacterium]
MAPIEGSLGDSDENPYGSSLCLYEDGARLTAAHSNIFGIRLGGAGRYQHWLDGIYFSTTDGSDPNINGRIYSVDHSLTIDEWQRGRIDRQATRWMQHKAGSMFLARGGDHVPPPLIANLGLTNKCNLRCEICGSQKHLDNTGVRRRHMEYATFQKVAETLFPLLSVVELNSQGDPLLHPQIEQVLETIEHHRCDMKIQHNGTLLRDSIIDLLLRQSGTILLSLDAVGPRFDEVRRGGVWAKAIGGLERLLRERDPKRLTVGVYPTLTARTIGEAMNVVRWCADHDIDEIGFHKYVPISESTEESPTEEQYQAVRSELREWAESNNVAQRILFEGEVLRSSSLPSRRREYADPARAVAVYDSGHMMIPMEHGVTGSDPLYTCASPNEYVEIGLDGQIGACCRSQDVVLGYATSPESFADAWFGRNYEMLRKSLRRGEAGAYPLPNCESCVNFYAPKEAGARCAVDYSKPATAGEDRLHFGLGDAVTIEGVQKEDGHCHIASFPLGIDGEFELWEDDRRLGPARSYHDQIRKAGRGSYQIEAKLVYFSTSDGTDARRNGRTYTLRRIDWAKVDVVPLQALRSEAGLCYTAIIPSQVRGDFELWENDQKLGPGSTYHSEIREHGQGRYHLGDHQVYFSTSDGTDPTQNGRVYELRRVSS